MFQEQALATRMTVNEANGATPALRALVARVEPRAVLVAVRPLGRDAAAGTTHKQGGYGQPLRLDLRRADGSLAGLHHPAAGDAPSWPGLEVGRPAAYRRAIRDLLGHGEGIFGIIDAYPSDVPAASPDRLACIEAHCLDWRWRLKGKVERLTR